MNITTFITENGIRVPAISAAQMREIDRIALEESGPNLYQMMENAGRNLALQAMEMMGERWQEARYLFLAGSGGNGGGAICAARHLANRGLNVSLCLAGSLKKDSVPYHQYRTFLNTSGKILLPDQLVHQRCNLIIDGLIGYSLLGAPTEIIIDLIQWANQSGSKILSLDIPSGVDATTGETPGEYVHSHTTMTLALPKTGLSPELCGSLVLADIAIPAHVFQKMGLHYTNPFGNRFRISIEPLSQHKLYKL